MVNATPYTSPAYNPTLSTYPGMTGYPGSATLSTNPYGYDSTLSTSSAYSGNSGYPSYGEDPAAGFLRGTSDVIRATGNFYKDVQAARLMQTQADESRYIDYRRKLIEEARYERGLLPTTEELRQQQLARDLAWARHQPPITDIVTGKPLNDLLHHLANDPARPKGPDVRIPDGVLDHVSVTSPTAPGTSLGLLKDDGKVTRPQSLAGKEYDTVWNDLTRTLESVVSEDLKFAHAPPPGKIMDLNADLGKLQNMVEKSDLSPSAYIDAKGYLDQVRASLQALQDPNAATNFNHKFNAKNVAELVDDMKAKGLDFAPAAPGDEGAYRALHEALVSYDYGVSQAQATPAAPPYKQP